MVIGRPPNCEGSVGVLSVDAAGAPPALLASRLRFGEVIRSLQRHREPPAELTARRWTRPIRAASVPQGPTPLDDPDSMPSAGSVNYVNSTAHGRNFPPQSENFGICKGTSLGTGRSHYGSCAVHGGKALDYRFDGNRGAAQTAFIDDVDRNLTTFGPY